MTSTDSAVPFTFTGRDGTVVTAYRWEPDGAPRGVVQLTHGMGEHLLRYGHLATTLAAAGFVVQGQDHRGNGATAPSEIWRSYMASALKRLNNGPIPPGPPPPLPATPTPVANPAPASSEPRPAPTAPTT